MGLENVPDAQSQNRSVEQCFQATAGSRLPKRHHKSTLFFFFFLNFFFKVISPPTVGLKLMTPRTRVARSANGAGQAPLLMPRDSQLRMTLDVSRNVAGISEREGFER